MSSTRSFASPISVEPEWISLKEPEIDGGD